MVYYIIRILLLIFIWLVIFLKYKSKFRYIFSTNNKKLWAIFYFVTISYTAFGVMIYLPVESLFMRFSTAEEAFAYSNIGYKIDMIIEGKDCAFIVYASSGSHHIDYVNKNGDQWLLVKRTLYRNEKLMGDKNYSVWFLEDPSTRQLLVLIAQPFPDSNIELDQAIISDSQNNNFERFQINEEYNLKTYYYYRVIDSSSIGHYEVVIDGSPFSYNK